MNDDMDEFYQERAAIILEHMAGYPREKAEALARAEAETYRKQQEAKKVAK